MALEIFHPIVSQWFVEKFKEPTKPQKLGWPSIAGFENTLIAAPTGSGKTLSAFLVCIDRLVRQAIQGDLEPGCKALYISPLKALASDVRKNLEIPLAEIQERVAKEGHFIPPIRAMVRTGDTPAHERQSINKNPPPILVTTPESLYLMLTSEKGRHALKSVETVIVDEIHALARDKRGSHLSLSLERLKNLIDRRPTMIGLSATQKPVEEIASFLVGKDERCNIINVGHGRELDLGLYLPPSALSTVATHEQWDEIYQHLADEIRNHRSTLLFVNTRRLAERVAFRLSEILGDDQVLCHHGSLSKERRLKAECMLKEGQLKAIVATASLELGIDIGYIDLVCQLGVPFSIANFLQRIGRSGHAIHATPKGRLVPLSRDELLESLALIKAVKDGHLDRIEMPVAPVDILAQQLIAECAGRGPESSMTVDEAFTLFTRAWPFRDLSREAFLRVVHMSAEGYAVGRRRFAYLIWDRLQNRLSVKGSARLTACTSGGAIPEMGDVRVVLEEDGTMLGTVNEDFAIDSNAGDIFLLGTHSWQVCHVRGGEMVVRDANGMPPSVPFWFGEAPGRTPEFSASVSEFRRQIAERVPESVLTDGALTTLESIDQWKEIPQTPFDEAIDWIISVTGVGSRWHLLQAVHYIAVQKAALGLVPTREKVVFERFFDEVGGMQLVIHSPYGARVNRGWGLALRKRFCRSFDFELQASADDDGIVMSLGPQQSFPIETLYKMLNAENVEHFLTQALLAAPMFAARWRWNATRALAVLRQAGGKRIAPALQRFRAEDLLTAIFPAQTACQENMPGDKEIPDHPLVKQTVHDCLTEAMDIAALTELFRRIEKGEVELVARDTREPSPFAYQLLNGYPYTFLDEAPLEDRRTRSVSMRPALSIQDLQDLDRMSLDAIQQVTKDAWPEPSTADELYEILVATPAFPLAETSSFETLKQQLLEDGRATIARGKNQGREFLFLVAAEAIPTVRAAYERATFSREIALPDLMEPVPSREVALQNILKGWLEIRGPVPTDEIKDLFALDNPESCLEAVEAGGVILRCRLDRAEGGYTHWCARGLLRRIHRLTVEGLREQIKPVSPQDYLEFILEEHGLNLSRSGEGFNGEDALLNAAARLQGFEAPARAWEKELFAGRVRDYEASFLDKSTAQGQLAFGRLSPKKSKAAPGKGQKMTSVVPMTFVLRRDWPWVAATNDPIDDETSRLSNNALLVWETLKNGGAQFVDEIESRTRLLSSQAESALAELAAEGVATCDHFQAFRGVLSPASKEKRRVVRSRRIGRGGGIDTGASGRWSLLRRHDIPADKSEERIENWAFQLLERYGIVFRDLLERESLAPSWGFLVRAFRRLEARGEVRGGRFISGVSGEQFGLSETHEKLIKVREERAQGKRNSSYSVISSSDPLNLIGIITKGDKIPSSPSTRVLIEAGELVGICRGNEIETMRPIGEEHRRALRLVGNFRNRATHLSLVS